MNLICITGSLKEVLYNLESTNILVINAMIQDIRNELEEIGKEYIKEDESVGLLIRDTVDELDNYVDCCNLKKIRNGLNLCINTLENMI